MRKPSSPGKEKKIEGKDKIRLKKDNNYNTIAIRKLHRTILYPVPANDGPPCILYFLESSFQFLKPGHIYLWSRIVYPQLPLRVDETVIDPYTSKHFRPNKFPPLKGHVYEGVRTRGSVASISIFL